jgi:hypothetical protein
MPPVLTWDNPGERLYETGVDRGVLYIPNNGIYDSGYPWNGLTTVTESPSGAEATALYADNMKYLNLLSAEEFGASLEAYTYPIQFAQCDGTALPTAGVAIGQQSRKSFGLSYRTRVGNDTLATDFGYKIHLIYGALAAPTEKAYATINDSPEAISFSWSLTTTPVSVSGFKPTAVLTIDSTKVSAAGLTVLENALYGTGGSNARLPLPDEVLAMFTGTVTSVTATAPTATAAGLITIPTVTGITYRRADTNAVVTGTVQIPGSIGSSLAIVAIPNTGFQFSAASDDDWVFTKTA